MGFCLNIPDITTMPNPLSSGSSEFSPPPSEVSKSKSMLCVSVGSTPLGKRLLFPIKEWNFSVALDKKSRQTRRNLKSLQELLTYLISKGKLMAFLTALAK
jgi:hypothetical protein